MKLVGVKLCPFIQRMVVLMEKQNFEYEIDYIDFKAPPAWFKKFSPKGQVPFLVKDDGEIIFNTDAIVEYLSSSDSSTFVSRTWVSLAEELDLLQLELLKSNDKKTFNTACQKLRSHCYNMEQSIIKNRGNKNLQMELYLDLLWLPIFHRSVLIKEFTDFDVFEGLANLKDWRDRLFLSQHFSRTITKDFSDDFKKSYIESDTYLEKMYKAKEISSFGG